MQSSIVKILGCGVAFFLVSCAHQKKEVVSYRDVPVSFSGDRVQVKFSNTPVPVYTEAKVVEVASSPAPAELVTVAPTTPVFELPPPLYFGEGRYALSDNDKLNLSRFAKRLDNTTRLKVQGFTNPHGSQAFNDSLGLRRAEIVREYLISQGIKPELIAVENVGNHGERERKAIIEVMTAE